jgi:hypothetical protein
MALGLNPLDGRSRNVKTGQIRAVNSEEAATHSPSLTKYRGVSRLPHDITVGDFLQAGARALVVAGGKEPTHPPAKPISLSAFRSLSPSQRAAALGYVAGRDSHIAALLGVESGRTHQGEALKGQVRETILNFDWSGADTADVSKWNATVTNVLNAGSDNDVAQFYDTKVAGHRVALMLVPSEQGAYVKACFMDGQVAAECTFPMNDSGDFRTGKINWLAA